MIAGGRCPNAVAYTALMDGFDRNGLMEDALNLFDDFPPQNLLPNSSTVLIRWLSVVRSAAFSHLIDSFRVEGFVHEVFEIAGMMPQGTSSAKNSLMRGWFILSANPEGAMGGSIIIYIIKKRGFVPSLVSYNNIIHGLRDYQLFLEGIEYGYSLPEPTYRALVEALLKEKITRGKNVMELMLSVIYDSQTISASS